MRAFSKRILLAVLLGVALLGLSGRRVFAQPDQQQELPEVTTAKREQRQRDEKRLKQNCAKKLKTYQLREGEFQGAKNRGQTPDVLLKRQKARDQAVKELCKCLEQFYGAYGDLPAEYKTEELDLIKLCFPPGGLPADPGPGIDPRTSPQPPPPATGHPCQAAWDEYKKEASWWGGSSTHTSALFIPHHDLCNCLKKHFAVLPPEWVEFCEDPRFDSSPPPKLPIYVVPPTEPRTPIMLPGEDGQPPGVGDSNRTDAPPLRGPRAGAPGSEPRSLVPGECTEQRAAYGRILSEYRNATGAARASLRPSLASAYRDLCECLRITAPADYQRFCQWSAGEPPDMPEEWGSVPAAPLPPPPSGGVPLPAGPAGPVDRFFGDRTSQQLRGAAVFTAHTTTNHALHCSVCSQVHDGVSVSFERSQTPGAIRVTVVDPPLPEISCQEQPGGTFDCGTVTASFCQMTPTVSIAHLKLGQNAVEDLGVRLEYPGDTLQFCTHGPTAP